MAAPSLNTSVPRSVCRIRVRLVVPGHPQRHATVWRSLDPWDIGAVEPGRNVAVDVDAFRPGRVRIDLGRPPTRPVTTHHEKEEP